MRFLSSLGQWLRTPRLFAAFVVLAVTPGLALAQYNTAEISGFVKDVQGAVIPGATVVALHVASGLRTERVTDAQGRFFLPALPVGDYALSVE